MFIEKYKNVLHEIYALESQSRNKRIEFGLQLLDDRKFSDDGVNPRYGAIERLVEESQGTEFELTRDKIKYILRLTKDYKNESSIGENSPIDVKIPSASPEQDSRENSRVQAEQPAQSAPAPHSDPTAPPPWFDREASRPRTPMEESVAPRPQQPKQSSHAKRLQKLLNVYDYPSPLWPDYWQLPEITIGALRAKVKQKLGQARLEVSKGKIEMKLVNELAAAVDGDEEKTVGEAVQKLLKAVEAV